MEENKTNPNIEETNTEENKTEVNTEQKENKTETNKINVEETKKQGVNEILAALGVDSKEDLQTIVSKYQQEQENKKTDLEKANDSNKTLTKRLVEEKERADIAEAKLAAITLGAKPDLVDDLVIVAKSKATEDKKILDVIEEIKKSNSGFVYFVSEEEKKEDKKNRTVTRTNSKMQEKKQKEEKEESEGGLAQRLFARKQTTRPAIFSSSSEIFSLPSITIKARLAFSSISLVLINAYFSIPSILIVFIHSTCI